MELRVFGRTGMQLSLLGFGCGAVGGLMIRGDSADQERTIARAIAAGVNYFDTAVQYGNGESEKNLGRILQKLKPANVAVGTKVRLPPSEFGRIADAVTMSLEGSLARLRLDQVDIFHLHNAITETGGEMALSVRQVLDDVVPAFERLRQQGKTRFLGITAVGDTAALHQVIDARAFDSAQVVYNMLNPSADELSSTRLWTIVRSHQGSRRWSSGYPRASRRRTVGLSRASPDCESGARADWLGYELRCRCRSRTPSNPAGKGGVCHQPNRSRHAVCAVSPGDGHYLGRYGDAAAVRGRTRRGPKRPTTASCARPAVSTAAGVLWRTTMIAQIAHTRLQLVVSAGSHATARVHHASLRHVSCRVAGGGVRAAAMA
jgi:aryl-alcohol dehydrogenase-like predicted oxidoreductase